MYLLRLMFKVCKLVKAQISWGNASRLLMERSRTCRKDKVLSSAGMPLTLISLLDKCSSVRFLSCEISLGIATIKLLFMLKDFTVSTLNIWGGIFLIHFRFTTTFSSPSATTHADLLAPCPIYSFVPPPQIPATEDACCTSKVQK